MNWILTHSQTLLFLVLTVLAALFMCWVFDVAYLAWQRHQRRKRRRAGVFVPTRGRR